MGSEISAHVTQAFSASLGDLIAVATLALAWLTFRLDRGSADRGDALAAIARLRSLIDGFFPVADRYFSTVYTPAVARQRAERALGKMDQVFTLPPEPIASLVQDQRAVEARLISAETMVLGTIALWQIHKINDLARKQAIFNAVHAPDFFDVSFNDEQRQAVVKASVHISAELHGAGIGGAQNEWYTPLKNRVKADYKLLQTRGFLRSVSKTWAFLPLDVAALAGLATVAVAYAHSH